ncbi:DUF7671 family protein [Weissella ceti]|uniref:DUF7671 domain-containing protein n=1 Tax=Weissella ceti TaxID=759620 RepID=A0A088GED1_9LACO|nr:hypothetical protein [Weissella ceti]AIM62286.1 hypothetical protein WS74_0034 [Weissella ceti]
MASKYPTLELIGIVLTPTNNGGFTPKEPITTHSWRHTKGKYTQPGQLFLTENQQTVVIMDTRALKFNARHDITPMSRFLTTNLDPETFDRLLGKI